MARGKRIVVKLGTNVITGEDDEPDRAFLETIADEVVGLREQGHEVLIVSSGAIGSGMGLLGYEGRVREVKLRQALAAVGQARLMGAWEDAFNRHGVHVGQLLLTYDALRDRSSYLRVRNATETLLDLGVVPIVNENDVVSVEEITGADEDPASAQSSPGRLDTSFGDNDKLSAYVATKAQADLLVLLSDVAGLYDKPPDEPDAELVPVVEAITEDVEQMAGVKSGSVLSRGGMRSKIEAARIVTQAGIPMVIANGREPGIISRVLDGELVGTRFLAQGAHADTEKKRWLRIARAQGTVHVDAGAAQALSQGHNLLPAGVTGVTGSFPAGSVVEIHAPEGTIAKAISQLSAKELELAKGLHSDEVRERLGREGSCNVTRKRGLVMLGGGPRGK